MFADSMINFDPNKVNHISLKKTENGTVLSIKLINKYADDVMITFQDYEEAKKAFDKIRVLVREIAHLTIDIPTEHELSIDFVSKVKGDTIGEV